MAKQRKGIFARGNQLYFRYTDAQGNRQWPPAGFAVGQEAEAAKVLAAIQKQVEAEKEFQQKAEKGGQLPSAGVTVETYGKHWNAKRLKVTDAEQAATEDKWKLEGHIFPALGHILLSDFRTRNARDFVAELRSKKRKNGSPLASRTIRSIWSALHNLFHEAVVDELIPINPCVLKRGELPPTEDKDPEWRDGAVFERTEVEQLISDERIPLGRRVLYAVLFLAGARPGEIFAATWSNYDARTQPLGRLTLVKGYNTRYQRVGRTKTKRRRLVPVHPTLAKVLATWKLSGWEAHVGRKPDPSDLIIPNAKGGHLRVDDTLNLIREDLTTLGLNAERRQYDSRRTFLSIAQGDGASQDLIRWVTHGARGNVVDDYTSIPWVPICNEMLKLRIELLSGQLVRLRASGAEKETVTETVSEFEGETRMIPRADIRIRTGDLLITKEFERHNPRQPSTAKYPKGLGLVIEVDDTAPPISPPPVSLSLSGVTPALREALAQWEASHDTKELRQNLSALSACLEGV